MTHARRRPMRRIGDLIPDAARALGLEDELRLARAIATFEALVAERVPAAAGACRVVRLEGFAIDVEADAPIVAQELRLRSSELLAAFAAAPGGRRRPRPARPRPPRRPARIIPRTCQPSRGDRRPIRPSDRPVARPSPYERPAWPPDSN